MSTSPQLQFESFKTEHSFKADYLNDAFGRDSLNDRNSQSISHLHEMPAANISNRLDHILQAMPSGIVIIDAEGVVTDANPVAIDLLGSPLTGLRWIKVINRAFSPQKDDGHEISLKNGRRVKLEITPLTPEPGQLIVLTDLTQTRLLQKNISHLQRLSALGKMVASLAHQVRTPLSAALLYASNLSNSKISNSARERFQGKLVDRLNELEHQVNDMLLMAKGRGQEPDSVKTIDELIELVLDNCQPIADKHRCELLYSNPTQLKLTANISSLSSAINNLVLNSIEAGASRIELNCYDAQEQVCIDIIDNGHGLDAVTEQQMLEPFFTTKAQGTGLGLAVVKSVITSHGGSITFSCKQGEGCTAKLVFPKPDEIATTAAPSARVGG